MLKRYFLLFLTLLCVSNTETIGQTTPNGGYYSSITWPILDCPQYPQYDYWEPNCLIRTAEPYGEIRLPQGGVDGLNLEKPMWITIPTNRPTWAIAIAHSWNLHRNMIQKVNFPKIGYYMAITAHETGMGCDCGATFSPGHTPWSTTGQGILNWPAKCGTGANSHEGCYQMEEFNAWGELNQILPERFACNAFDENIPGPSPSTTRGHFETQTLAMTYRNFTYSLLMEYSWNMNPWDVFQDPNCDKYAYEKFLAAGWNGSISGTYATMAQSNAPPSTRPNPVNMFSNRANTKNNPEWDLDGTVAYYPEVIAWSLAAIEGNTSYPGYQYDPTKFWGALTSTGTGMAGEFDYYGAIIPAGGKLQLNSVNGSYPGHQNHVQLGYYNGNIYWSDVSAYLDIITNFYWEFAPATKLNPIKTRVQNAFVAISGSTSTPIPFKQLGPVIDEILMSFPKENPLISALQTDGLPHGPNGNEFSTCTGKYSPASHIVPRNLTTSTICKGQSVVLAGVVVGGEEPNMSYTWFKNGTQVSAGINDSNYVFTAVTPGTYQFKLIVCNANGGCSPACDFNLTVNNCSACPLVATTTQVNTPCKNTEGGKINLTIIGSTNYTVQYTGPNNGTRTGTASTMSITNLLNGVYNITVTDNSNPLCFYTTSQTVGYDYNLNEVVDATILAKRDCEVDLKASIVRDNCQCDYTVYAASDIPNRWERYITMKITPTNGMFEIFRGDVFSLNAQIARKFQLCTGDSIKGELHIQPASGSCDARRTDAVNVQRESYTVWVKDPNGTEVFRRTFPAGTAQQYTGQTGIGQGDYLMFNIPINCPYISPDTYTFVWNPSAKTTPMITEHGSGKILYHVTATNVQHPQCKLKDSILVPFTCSTALPITFLFVKATKTSYGAEVKWQAIEDSDNSPYIVERSLNPADGFTQIGTVPVYNGNYSFQDTNMPEGKIVYYRIVKRNTRDKLIYSNIVAVYNFDISFTLLPNPSAGSGILHTNDDKGEYKVLLFNALGQLVESHALVGELEIGNGLDSGIYFVKINGENGTNEIIKFVKEK
jgi:hypothetical protein